MEPFGDDDVEDDDSDGRLTVLADAVSRTFDEYREVLDIGGAEAPDDPRVLSYLVAAARSSTSTSGSGCGGAGHRQPPAGRARGAAPGDRLIGTFGAVPATELPVWPVNSN